MPLQPFDRQKKRTDRTTPPSTPPLGNWNAEMVGVDCRPKRHVCKLFQKVKKGEMNTINIKVL